MRLYLILAIFFLSFNLGAQSDGYKITIQTENYENDTLITGYYFADRQLVQDTLIGNDGTFIMEGEKELNPGMYLAIFKPDNDFIQFMVNGEEQEFSLRVNSNDKQNVAFDGSKDNKIFYEYIAFIQKENKKADELNKRIQAAEEKGEVDADAQLKMSGINEKVKDYQMKIIEDYPESIIARLLKSGQETDFPEFTGTPEEINNKKFYYYKRHFFDHIDLGDSVNLRMPYLHQRITNYVDRLTPQVPDSIIIAVDYILDKVSPAKETYRYYVSHFLNTYAKSKIVGMDAVYVHLVDKYYSTGVADWVGEETLIKLKDNADMLRPTLIGKKAQDIKVYDQNGEAISLYDVEAEYMLLYFYAYDCGHCKKSTPFIVEFNNKYQDKGIKVMAICTKRDTTKCWDYVKEKEMDGIINVTDPNNRSGFRAKYDVRQTPKMYILNREKEILIKNFPAEEIDAIMDDIIRIDKERKEKETGIGQE
jgi:peroxiredoxin